MYPLDNAQMRHDWGSPALIQQLMGEYPDGKPLAEVWMGGHPLAPSTAVSPGRRVTLDRLIENDPQRALGPEVSSMFGRRLPYLAKFLAASRALSIQVHPSQEQARRGFEADNRAGLPRESASRNYRDASHKPEMVYALTRFELLSGLREPEQSAKFIDELGVRDLHPLVRLLRDAPATTAHRDAFAWLLAQQGTNPAWVREVSHAAHATVGSHPETAIVARLADEFAADPTVLAPYLLNYVVLEPGQAVFTGAGTLHAYLRGLAVEVMAASDNVLRAGLTSKRIDVAELMEVADFTPRLPGLLTPWRREGGATLFTPPADEFAVAVCTPAPGVPVRCPATGPRIVIGIAGSVEVRAGDVVRVDPGSAIFVPHADGDLLVGGDGRAVVVYTPAHGTPDRRQATHNEVNMEGTL